MNEKERIELMVQDMSFERRTPISKPQKALYAHLQLRACKLCHAAGRLHLRLWHAVKKSDYKSLPLCEAESLLLQMRDDIDDALQKLASGPPSPYDPPQ